MIKVFIGQVLAIPSVPILYPNLGFDYKGGGIFVDRVFSDFSKPFVIVVDDPARADFLLLPHNYFQIKHQQKLITAMEELSLLYKKRIIVFAYGDSAAKVDVRNAMVFRSSQYRFALRPNEIMMPAYVEDLSGYVAKITPREKKERPTVGFCGWVGTKSFLQAIKFNLKNLIVDLQCKKATFKQGLYFRHHVLSALSHSQSIDTNFILRDSYFLHRDTSNIDPDRGRAEYISNILSSDFSLAVKGDGNFSARFYEILSLSRVPVFIDTECVLPLEDVIDYSKFMLRISYKDIKYTAKAISSFYSRLTNEDFILMQKKAREAFENYLRIDKFFEYYFSDIDKLNTIAVRISKD